MSITSKKDKLKYKHKERHKRPKKGEVNILDYEPLIWKVISGFARKQGIWVYEYKEELKQIGYIALISALKDYDPKRGTFVTLGYLRVYTHLIRFLRKQAIQHGSCYHLEELNTKFGKGLAIAWQDLFPSNEIDLNVIARLAVSKEDDIDWKLLDCLINGVPKRSIPKKLGLTHTETARRLALLRENMVFVTNEIYTAE